MNLESAIDWETYRAWLTTQYNLSTARKGVTDLRTIVCRPEVVKGATSRQRQKDYVWAWDTWVWYTEQTGVHNPLPRSMAPSPPAPLTRDARRKAAMQVKAPELAFDLESYKRLRQLVREDKHQTAPALDVIVHTGLRVQDVLRTPAAALRAGLADPDGRLQLRVKGGKPVVALVRGAPESWRRLGAWVAYRGAENVAQACTKEGNANPDGDGAAYRACDRAFKRLAAEAGAGGRLHLHRARRTLAVYARKLVDAGDVRELLSHQQQSTTHIYTGVEAGAEVAADVLERVNRRLG